MARTPAALDLTAYDLIVVNSSAGKDSQAMLDLVAELAKAAGVLDRVVVSHADLRTRKDGASAEWAGVRELAEEQASFYGFRFEVERRTQDGLLDYAERRGRWPSSAARWCTSEFKRSPGNRVITRLARELKLGRTVRVLSCFGFRAEESPARAKRPTLSRDERASSSKKSVDLWLPIHDWTVGQVWARIAQAGTRHHQAYDLGMPRLSCVFCIMAGRAALTIAAAHNRELLDRYIEVEEKTGHTFKHGESLQEIRQDVLDGKVPKTATDWKGC